MADEIEVDINAPALEATSGAMKSHDAADCMKPWSMTTACPEGSPHRRTRHFTSPSVKVAADHSVRIDVGMAFMPMAMIFPAAAASAVVVLMHVIVPARAPFLVVIMPTCAFLIVGMLT